MLCAIRVGRPRLRALLLSSVDLRDTFGYAKLTATGIVEDCGHGDGNGDAPGVGGKDLLPKTTVETLPPTGAGLPKGEPGMRTDTFILEEGPVVALQYPGAWSQSSYEDFKDWMEIELRKIKRLIKTDPGDNQTKESQ